MVSSTQPQAPAMPGRGRHLTMEEALRARPSPRQCTKGPVDVACDHKTRAQQHPRAQEKVMAQWQFFAKHDPINRELPAQFYVGMPDIPTATIEQFLFFVAAFAQRKMPKGALVDKMYTFAYCLEMRANVVLSRRVFGQLIVWVYSERFDQYLIQARPDLA
ncbi:hypothetical protein MSAN_00697500 [Mycena sanguinolenta]|uniref:Uncharacterized protein n=1 Tax=Mycena sanguinolenta TaxID=230812 RepID=A0A8H7DDR3_9AGAR|nr:hypothetical protein MSAN_00697500 [Mycena sanguinolenta]